LMIQKKKKVSSSVCPSHFLQSMPLKHWFLELFFDAILSISYISTNFHHSVMIMKIRGILFTTVKKYLILFGDLLSKISNWPLAWNKLVITIRPPFYVASH
jgi:hypothetical protein